MATIRVCSLENEPFATLVCSILKKRRIPFNLVRTHDRVLDGINEGQMAWGYIEAPETHSNRILQIVDDLKPRIARSGPSDDTQLSLNRRSNLYVKIAIAVVPVLVLAILWFTAIGSNTRMKAYLLNKGGLAWYERGNYERAIADYNKAIEAYPRSAAAHSNRGLAWSMKGEYDRAIADCDTAIELNPNLSAAYVNRGIAWSHNKDVSAK